MPDTLVTPETDDKVNATASQKEVTGGRPGVTLLRTGGSRFALIGVWILMIGLYTVLSPSLFFTSGTFTSIFNSHQVDLFLTCSLLCTIIVGEFVDLSVPSVLCLAATIVPVLSVQHGWSIPLACAAALAACLVVGAIQGALVVYMKVNTIVVTLGMGTFLLGIALWISNLNYVTGLPSSFANIDLANVFGLPISFYYGIAMMLVFAYILVFTPLGRHMRFVGSNREVSRLAGIRVNRIRFGAFVAAAVVAGVGGIIASAGLGGFNPQDSATYLLPTFAAVFLGTAVVVPGKFNPLGTVVAIYFLATGIQGLQDLGAAGWVTDVFYGGVLVVAVALTTQVQRMLSGS